MGCVLLVLLVFGNLTPENDEARAICILLSDRIIFQNSESAATIKILESKVQIGDERKVRIRCLQRNLELVLLLLLIFNTLKSLNILHVQFIFYYSKQAFESTLKNSMQNWQLQVRQQFEICFSRGGIITEENSMERLRDLNTNVSQVLDLPPWTSLPMKDDTLLQI